MARDDDEADEAEPGPEPSAKQTAYAEGLFEALGDPDQRERFDLAVGDLDGDPTYTITCDGKPVLLVLDPDALEALEDMLAIRAEVEADEDEEEPPPPKKRAKSRAGWRP